VGDILETLDGQLRGLLEEVQDFPVAHRLQDQRHHYFLAGDQHVVHCAEYFQGTASLVLVWSQNAFTEVVPVLQRDSVPPVHVLFECRSNGCEYLDPDIELDEKQFLPETQRPRAFQRDQGEKLV